MSKRLFTFGCSYTQYTWPTWADILKECTECKTYNFGRAGIGNVGIMHKIIEADLKYKFTKDDVIAIVWSCWSREDRYHSGEWASHGNVFNNPLYDRKFIRKYWSYENDIVKNATAIICINKLFSEIIGFQGHIVSPGGSEPYEQPTSCNLQEEKLFNFYMEHIPITNIFKNNDLYEFDGHPSVLEHLEFVIDNVCQPLNITVSSSTELYYRTLNTDIREIADSSSNRQKKTNDIISYLSQIKGPNCEKN